MAHDHISQPPLAPGATGATGFSGATGFTGLSYIDTDLQCLRPPGPPPLLQAALI